MVRARGPIQGSLGDRNVRTRRSVALSCLALGTAREISPITDQTLHGSVDGAHRVDHASLSFVGLVMDFGQKIGT